MNLTLSANHLCRFFSNRKVINDLSFKVEAPGSLGITGPNGSGKTTVMKMIAHLLPPSKGRVELSCEGQPIAAEIFIQYVKMVSPDLALYEMLTGSENLRFFSRLADIKLTPAEVESKLEQVGLRGRGNDLVATYSSGMKQRLKYAVALLSQPAVLLLDEPPQTWTKTANL